MKNITVLLISLILFSFPNLVCSQSYLDEEEVEDTWTVSVERYGDSISDWVVVASVNGKVTRGDRLRVKIPIKTIERCSIGNTMTTFYTTNIDNEAEDQFLEGVMIPAKLNNIDIYVNLLFAINFFDHHLVYVDISYNPLEYLKDYFKEQSEVSLMLKDRINQKGITLINSDYFDVSLNNFSLNGFNAALDRARTECERLIAEVSS
jgi:hypothetical protein